MKAGALKLAAAQDAAVVCPHCKTAMDAASGVVDKHARHTPKPKPNDFTICIECGGLAAFTETLSLRPLTNVEQAKADADPRIKRTLEAFWVMRGRAH